VKRVCMRFRPISFHYCEWLQIFSKKVR
jgi:hypothetical protein